MHKKFPLSILIVFLSFAGCTNWRTTGIASLIMPPSAVLPDGSQYYGDIQDEVFSGHGRLVWPGGASFEGEFVDGQMSGIGKYIYNSGDVYEGQFQNGAMSGDGFLKMMDGSSSRGQFENDDIEGQGHYAGESGGYYEGNFHHGYYHGVGKLVAANETTYIGDFEHGQYSGEGIVSYPNGNQYRGGFKKNLFNGHGKFSSANDDVYIGTFVDGEFSGSGIFQNEAGDTYNGEFKNWVFHGEGVYTYKEGVELAGTFKKGSLNGYGTLISAGGRYAGEFVDGKMSGSGVLTKQNGDRYSGLFQSGLFHGQGELIYGEPKNGVNKLVGEWSYGKFVEHRDAERNATHQRVEQALYSQAALLDKSLNQLLPTQQETVNLYFVGVAGYGEQDVFMKEVDFIKQQFDDNYLTKQRSVVLINNKNTVARFPMATLTSIELTLKAVAEKMDRDNDILFLYLTSHGSEKHKLSIDQKGLDLADLPAQRLAEMLEELSVKWKVVVVSACYSGGFIPQLKNEHTLIMTAASHDKKSFGCSDAEDMTYFGRAFFKEALPGARSFDAAFKNAKKLIYAWEESFDTHSSPQIHAPLPILAHLKKWRGQLESKSIASSQATISAANSESRSLLH